MLAGAYRTISYPIAGDRGERPVLAGWILVLASFFVPVLPLVPLVGYLVRVLVSSAAAESGTPAFVRDGIGLVRVGVGATMIFIAYAAIPLGVLLVTIYGLIESPRVPENLVETIAFFTGTTVAAVLSLLSSYLVPLAVTAYGRERRLRAAFAPAKVQPLARSREVFVAWAVAAVVTTVGVALSLELLSLSRLGSVLAALVVVYASILAVHRLGVGIARAER